MLGLRSGTKHTSEHKDGLHEYAGAQPVSQKRASSPWTTMCYYAMLMSHSENAFEYEIHDTKFQIYREERNAVEETFHVV